VSRVSLVPVPSENPEPMCAGCGAALVPDQRYCLSCGQPCSPVRLAFLDVLQSEHNRPAQRSEAWVGPGAIELGPAGYAPVAYEQGLNGWLLRYSGLLALFAVLAMCLLIGLLVGHWVTQGKATGKQVVEVKGLTAAPAAPSASPTSTTAAEATPGTATTNGSNAKAEAEEAKQAAKETPAEKAPPPAPVKVKPQTIKKLSNSKGAQHQQEINKLIEGGKPIETG
jgi:hypothetical protein